MIKSHRQIRWFVEPFEDNENITTGSSIAHYLQSMERIIFTVFVGIISDALKAGFGVVRATMQSMLRFDFSTQKRADNAAFVAVLGLLCCATAVFWFVVLGSNPLAQRAMLHRPAWVYPVVITYWMIVIAYGERCAITLFEAVRCTFRREFDSRDN